MKKLVSLKPKRQVFSLPDTWVGCLTKTIRSWISLTLRNKVSLQKLRCIYAFTGRDCYFWSVFKNLPYIREVAMGIDHERSCWEFHLFIHWMHRTTGTQGQSHHDNTQLPILGKNKWMGMDIDNKITTIANNNDKTHQWDIYNTL